MQIEGPARIVGVGNGDPLSHESFQGRSVRAFNGLALAILTATDGEDEIKPDSERKLNEIIVRVSANGLETAEIRLQRGDGKQSSGTGSTSGDADESTRTGDGDARPVD